MWNSMTLWIAGLSPAAIVVAWLMVGLYLRGRRIRRNAAYLASVIGR